MINSLSKVSYGYTDKGNCYEKSSAGKKTGKIAGVAVGVTAAHTALACYANDYKSTGILSPKNAWNGIKKMAEEAFQDVTSTKLCNFFKNNKSARIAFVIGFVSLIPLVYMGLGKLIGHGYDKIVDHFTMKKADKAAEAEQK